MIGVILWSSPSKDKAVIWCDDHGALAYLQGRENLSASSHWPEVGDLVELEIETISDLRHARSVTLVSGNKRSELPGLLRGIGDKRPSDKPILRVISNQDRESHGQPLKVAAVR